MMTSFSTQSLEPSKAMRFGGAPFVDVEKVLKPTDSSTGSVINEVSWFKATNIPSLWNQGISFNGCQK